MQLIFIIKDYHWSEYGNIVGIYSTKELAYIGVQKYLEHLDSDVREYLGGQDLEKELKRIKKIKEKFLPIMINFEPHIGYSSSACQLSIESMPLYCSIRDFDNENEENS